MLYDFELKLYTFTIFLQRIILIHLENDFYHRLYNTEIKCFGIESILHL